MKADILIVGSGFAGAATAFHLSQSFSGLILLIDKEEVPGFHASGRNASLVLQSTELPEIRQVIAASSRAYAEHRSELGFNECGSLLLGSKHQLEKVRQTDLIHSVYENAEKVRSEISLLEDHDFEAALWTPSDGVMDISALLQFYLCEARARQVRLLLNCQLTQVEGTGPYRLKTSQGEIEATYLINAAGAWAPRVAEMAGATKLPLSPLKRHLFVLGETSQVKRSWPFVWNLEQNFYFRPESGDVLFSVCDEQPGDSLEPAVNPETSQLLAELIWNQLPALRGAVQKRVWSCFRTQTPDRSLVIGWDPTVQHFFWVAGLGGHGMGGSWEVGRLAAHKFLNREISGRDRFDPSRFEEHLEPARGSSGRGKSPAGKALPHK